jgi:hypothetical protein
MIWAFVVVCLGVNCPWGVWSDSAVSYGTESACQDSGDNRLQFIGILYPMRYRFYDSPWGVKIEPDRYFLYRCAGAP